MLPHLFEAGAAAQAHNAVPEHGRASRQEAWSVPRALYRPGEAQRGGVSGGLHSCRRRAGPERNASLLPHLLDLQNVAVPFVMVREDQVFSCDSGLGGGALGIPVAVLPPTFTPLGRRLGNHLTLSAFTTQWSLLVSSCRPTCTPVCANFGLQL